MRSIESLPCHKLCVAASLWLAMSGGIPPAASAQDLSRAEPMQATIDQLVATALEQSPEIRAARAEIAAAGGQLTQARLRPNPTVSASQMFMTGEQHLALFEVAWPLDLYRRPGRVKVAQSEVNATTLSIRNRERLLAASVRQQAGRLLAARRDVEVMTEALTAARRTRELLDAQVTEGEIPKIDANIAAVEAGRIEADLAVAQADADAATIELKALVGMPANTPLVLRDSLEQLVRGQDSSSASAPPAPPATPVPAAPITGRADVQEAAARVALATERIDQARREGRADLSLIGNYGRESYGFSQRGFDAAGRLVPVQGNFRSATFGASVTLPFRNRNQGTVAAAEAERSGQQEVLAARQLAAQAELEAATVRDRETRRAVDMYATSIRDLARQNVDVQLEAYDLGRTPLTELLAEQRRYLEVEAAYTNMLERAYQAGVALRRARGDIR